jgi:hypothetical protein
VLAPFLAAGCGGGEPEHVQFKKTDTSQFEDMSKAMMKNVQSKQYVQPGK